MASCSSLGREALWASLPPNCIYMSFLMSSCAILQINRAQKSGSCKFVKTKVRLHKVRDGQHVCSANAKFALLLLPHSLNGSMVQGLTIHRIRISAWHIYAIQRMDYNYYKYSKHIYILIQAPYNTDIYKISMKMKPVRQIMYSVDVTVFFSLWVNPNWYSRRRGGW